MLLQQHNKILFFKRIIIFSQHVIMERPRLEEENIIKDVRNLFRLEILKKLKNKKTDTTIKDIRNLFRLEKENKAIKDRVIIDTRNLF